MNKNKKQIEDKTLNNIFAAAFDYLKRNYRDEFHSCRALAEKMGVNKSTITNIMRCYTPVTEDTITKLQTACGCIFNLQWLRGQSDVMLAKDLKAAKSCGSQSEPTVDITTVVIAAKDETIAALRLQLADKDEIIVTKDALISTLQQQIAKNHNIEIA